MNHGHIVKYGKSDWLKIQNKYSAHAQKIGSGQGSRSLVLTKRIAASGEENVKLYACKSIKQNLYVGMKVVLKERTLNSLL